MRLVIEIDEDEYKKLVNPYQYNEALCDKLKRIVRNGMPLEEFKILDKSASSESGWISAKEKTPPPHLNVLTQDIEGVMCIDYFYGSLNWWYSQHHVVAWRPLPKPYKESEDLR